ncbi:mesenteric estrogen-dependent adipogenesis protein-like isoform X2 [Dunckerocampus dactyliophorus]|uniref:mesenteric estrogen-dependent adipogenesis protein-like isoform X2 n=1 Tax=Dunckerocampus dactyliophorus TaxID=161453 RepID=UPI0024072766|nr:mesenteric estrogen-dependent adipogenesis protein-like isoform X2 [Dunckerocampus dactyliophorus]
MYAKKISLCRMTVTELDDFLRKPPSGVSVSTQKSTKRVHIDPATSLLLADPCDALAGSVVFQGSLGRIRLTNLWEYSSFRKSLVSKTIYLLVSTHLPNSTDVMKRYVVSMDGANPLVRWQLERGLDWTISSVAGESYQVEIDLSDALDKWASRNFPKDNKTGMRPQWADASFMLKYHSDALFDFPYWFGLSKRKFKLRLT